jgi:hypothetical protein
MSTEKSVRDIVEEWNARAKAEGCYLDQDPWSVPPAEGSLRDIPATPESRERVEKLKQQLAELQRQREKPPERTVTEGVGEAGQEAQPLPSEDPVPEEQPSPTAQA